MTVAGALALARERGLDLVEVAPNAEPPVCRILDYGKLRYLYSKKEREAKKSQKNTSLREVRMRPRIGSHDFDSKVRKVKELLDTGSKVKVAVVFRGREVTHREIGMALLKRMADQIEELARLEAPPNMEGRAMAMVLVPSPKKVDKKAAKAKPEVDQAPEDQLASLIADGNGTAAMETPSMDVEVPVVQEPAIGESPVEAPVVEAAAVAPAPKVKQAAGTRSKVKVADAKAKNP